MTIDQAAPPRRGNSFGTASLVAGVLMLLAGVAAQSFTPAIPVLLAETGASYRTIPFLISLPPAILAVITTILGIIGLLIRDRTRVPAIIGTTLGASHLIVGVAGLVGAGAVAALLG